MGIGYLKLYNKKEAGTKEKMLDHLQVWSNIFLRY